MIPPPPHLTPNETFKCIIRYYAFKTIEKLCFFSKPRFMLQLSTDGRQGFWNLELPNKDWLSVCWPFWRNFYPFIQGLHYLKIVTTTDTQRQTFMSIPTAIPKGWKKKIRLHSLRRKKNDRARAVGYIYQMHWFGDKLQLN